jgi:hypothetical protein
VHVTWRGVNVQESSYKLRFEVFTAVVMKGTIFLDITPWSPLKICFPSAFRLVFCSAYSSLKMEAIFSWLSTGYTSLYHRKYYSSASSWVGNVLLNHRSSYTEHLVTFQSVRQDHYKFHWCGGHHYSLGINCLPECTQLVIKCSGVVSMILRSTFSSNQLCSLHLDIDDFLRKFLPFIRRKNYKSYNDGTKNMHLT